MTNIAYWAAMQTGHSGNFIHAEVEVQPKPRPACYLLLEEAWIAGEGLILTAPVLYQQIMPVVHITPPEGTHPAAIAAQSWKSSDRC